MIERCEKPNNPAYVRYGGRGIKVCDEWRRNFIAFCEWSRTHGYRQDLTLDRIDNNKGYSPDNCRWISNKEQQRNKRTNRIIEFDGKSLTVVDWCELTGLKKSTLLKRLNSGWSVEDALTKPLSIEKSSAYRNYI